MYRIIKIGMDVHSKNYTLFAMEPVIGEEYRVFANIQKGRGFHHTKRSMESKRAPFCLCKWQTRVLAQDIISKIKFYTFLSQWQRRL